MATSLKFTTSGDFESFRKFVRAFPELRLRFMSSVGKRGRGILKTELLSGQDLDLSAYPTDSLGRHTISSKVNRRATGVDIRSYPVNLYDGGRTLRSGEAATPTGTITVKLAGMMEARMQSIADAVSASILDTAMENV